MNLQKKALSGIAWTFSEAFFLNGLILLTTIYLARLLGPEAFGLIGMISIFVAIGTTLVDSGMSSSLVRSSNVNNKDFSTVFYVNLVVSVVVYLLVFFSAPLISAYYNQPLLTPLLRVYCLNFVIGALSAVQLAILNREMNFRKIATLNAPATVVSILTAIIMAYLDCGVWSIIGMYLSKQIVLSIGLWVSTKWKPSLYFSKNRLKLHFDFGYKLMLSSLLNTVYLNIYNIIIGKFYPVRMVGYFDRAKTYNNYPVTVISTIVGRVTYPLLAKLVKDNDVISNTYRKILQLLFFVTAPLMLVLGAIADPLFKLVLGKEWIAGIPFFQILCIASIFYPVHAFNLNILKVHGRSDLFLKTEIIKKLIATVFIVGFAWTGIWGLVWSSVIVSIISLYINMVFSTKLIKYSMLEQAKDIIPTFLAALTSAAIAYLCVRALSDFNLIIQLAGSAIVGALAYIGITLLFKFPQIPFALKLLKRNKDDSRN